MRKNFLLINAALIFLIAVLYYVLSSKSHHNVINALANLQIYLKDKQINVWDASFEETNINSFKSFNVKNFHFGFDYPTNDLKFKLSLKIENVYISWPDFSAKEIAVKISGFTLSFLKSDEITNAYWLSGNYPFVGFRGSNLDFILKNDQQDIRKTVESNLKEFFKLLEVGNTALNFNFKGKFKLNKDDAPLEANVELLKKDNNYFLKADFDKFISNMKYLYWDKDNLYLFKDYWEFMHILDFDNYLSKEIENAVKEQAEFPVDAYTQMLSGFLLKIFFKEDYINQFLELKLKEAEIKSPSVKEMYLNNFKLGATLADSRVKEEELKKILFDDKRVRLRPSNFSIKVK